MKKTFLSLVALICFLSAESQTVGLIQHGDSSLDEGYVLFAPTNSTTTYLIDKCGKKVKTWNSTYRTGHSAYLLSDGSLLRAGTVGNPIFNAGGNGGIIEKIDWTNKVVWSYKISDNFKCQHHDIKALPNGNVLAIVWESKTNLEAIDAGRDPSKTAATIWSEQILEIKPIGKDSGEVVWQWHLWDHLVQEFDPLRANFAPVATNPQLMDLNYGANNSIKDWIHLNSIDYNEDLDQIMLSSLNTDEIWIIDHSTTTAQSASHSGGKAGKGGDILYRWGNPRTYHNGSTADQKLFGQHNARWVDKGYPYSNQIMVFNNGAGRTGGIDSLYSTVEIINPPLSGFSYSSTIPYLPSAPSWIYNKGNPNNFFATNISGAQPLSNGNVLICHGPFGTFTEVTKAGKQVWKYINPVSGTGIAAQNSTPVGNNTFRCTFYPFTFKGFVGHTLKADSVIEDKNLLSDSCKIVIKLGITEAATQKDFSIFPNPANEKLTIKVTNFSSRASIRIFNYLGLVMQQIINAEQSDQITIPLFGYPQGMYFVQIQEDELVLTKKLIIEN